MEGRDTVPFDLPCDSCGYNLRGAQVGGQCAECGRGVWEVLGAVTMKALKSEVKWVRLRDRPLGFVRALRVAALAGGIANGLAVASVVVAFWVGWRVFRDGRGDLPGIVTGMLACAVLAALVSLEELGKSISKIAERRKSVWLGSWLLRSAAIAYPAMMVVAATSSKAGLSGGPLSPGVWLIAYTAGIVAALGAGLRVICLQWFLRVECQPWVGWAVAVTFIPIGLVLFGVVFGFANLVSDWRYQAQDRWGFVLWTTPVPSNGWVQIMMDVWVDATVLSGRVAFRWAVAITLSLLQLCVIAGDLRLATLAHRDLRRRKREPSEAVSAKVPA